MNQRDQAGSPLEERIKGRDLRLTRSEAKIADYLMVRSEEAAFLSASSIGRKAGVSKATVVRFATKLGYRGFTALQANLQGEINLRLQRLHRKWPAPGFKGRLLNEYLEANLKNLAFTYQRLSLRELDEAVEAMRRARRVFVMGQRKSFGLAYYFTCCLNVLTDQVQLLSSGESLLAERLLDIDSTDFLWALSFKRYSRDTVIAARQFSRVGAAVALITDSFSAPLVKDANHVFVTVSDGTALFDSGVATVSLLDLIILMLGRKLPKKQVFERLHRAEWLWTESQTFWNGSPGVNRKRGPVSALSSNLAPRRRSYGKNKT